MLSLDNVFSIEEFLAWAARVEEIRRPPRRLPLRTEDRRPRDQPALRERQAHHRRHPRRRRGRRGRHREHRLRPQHPAPPARQRAPAAGRGARRGVLPGRRLRIAQRQAGRGRRPDLRQRAQRGQRLACGRRPRARPRPRCSSCAPDSAACRCSCTASGAWDNPPVTTQSQTYELLSSWGLPTSSHYKVVPSMDDVAGFIEYFGQNRSSVEHETRRHRDQGRRTRTAPRTRRHQPRPALGDRLQVPAGAGQHQAPRHRRQRRPHRPGHPVRRDGEGAGRRLRGAPGDAAQPGCREGEGRA